MPPAKSTSAAEAHRLRMAAIEAEMERVQELRRQAEEEERQRVVAEAEEKRKRTKEEKERKRREAEEEERRRREEEERIRQSKERVARIEAEWRRRREQEERQQEECEASQPCEEEASLAVDRPLQTKACDFCKDRGYECTWRVAMEMKKGTVCDACKKAKKRCEGGLPPKVPAKGKGKKRARTPEENSPKGKGKQRRQRSPSPAIAESSGRKTVDTEEPDYEYDNQPSVDDLVSELVTMNRRLERLTEDQRAAQERYLQEMREGFGRVVAGDAEFCREVREGFDRVVALLQQGGAAGVAESLTCANEMKALKYIK